MVGDRIRKTKKCKFSANSQHHVGVEGICAELEREGWTKGRTAGTRASEMHAFRLGWVRGARSGIYRQRLCWQGSDLLQET